MTASDSLIGGVSGMVVVGQLGRLGFGRDRILSDSSGFSLDVSSFGGKLVGNEVVLGVADNEVKISVILSQPMADRLRALVVSLRDDPELGSINRSSVLRMVIARGMTSLETSK